MVKSKLIKSSAPATKSSPAKTAVSKKAAAKKSTKPKGKVAKAGTKGGKAKATVAAAAGGKKKGKKAKRDPLKPKRALSAYLFFCKDERPKLKAAQPDITVTEVVKKCAAAWQEIKDDKSKTKKWDDLHDEDVKRAASQMAKYKATAKEMPAEASDAEESQD